MNRINRVFRMLKGTNRAALIPFIVAGDPDLKTTEKLVLNMAASGADLIELGVPFSDPLADGPIIQAAAQRALQNGVNLESVLNLAKNLKGKSVPLIIMTYFNPVFRYGLKSFAEKCKEGEIEGVIIPDLPPEEAGFWIKEARRVEIATIFLTTPTSSPERIKLVNRFSRGFIYHVSVTGVTGTRSRLPGELASTVRQIKEYTNKPVAVGFGLSNPEQAKEVSRYADGIIVGSAIIKIMEEERRNKKMIPRVGNFIKSLSLAMHRF